MAACSLDRAKLTPSIGVVPFGCQNIMLLLGISQDKGSGCLHALLKTAVGARGAILDTLYEPNGVFSQFLGSASMTFLFSFHFLASSSCLAF